MPIKDPEARRRYYRAHYRTHHDQHRERAKSKRARYLADGQAMILDALKPGCVDCGENDPVVLDFDHRQGETKTFSVTEGFSGRRFGLTRIRAEIAKCDVRCANCHRRRTALTFGYWRTKNLAPPASVDLASLRPQRSALPLS